MGRKSCTTEDLVFYPFLDLLEAITNKGDVRYLFIDPGTDHGVGFQFDEEGPRMFRLKRIEDMIGKRPV